MFFWVLYTHTLFFLNRFKSRQTNSLSVQRINNREKERNIASLFQLF